MDLIENSSQHSAADFTTNRKKGKTALKLEPIRMVEPPSMAAPSYTREPSSNQELLTNSNISLRKKDSSSSCMSVAPLLSSSSVSFNEASGLTAFLITERQNLSLRRILAV